jgi:hypothetical protein
MCWQLVISISQIIAAAINRGTEGINSTVAYRVPMGVQVVFPVIVLAGLWWVPESPRWLLRKGKKESARKALVLVHRGEQYTPDEDLSVLQQDIDDESLKAAESSWMDLVRDPIERRKVVYSAGALIAQQINGIQWFYYFGTVFSKAIGLQDPFLMTLIVFVSQHPFPRYMLSHSDILVDHSGSCCLCSCAFRQQPPKAPASPHYYRSYDSLYLCCRLPRNTWKYAIADDWKSHLRIHYY